MYFHIVGPIKEIANIYGCFTVEEKVSLKYLCNYHFNHSDPPFTVNWILLHGEQMNRPVGYYCSCVPTGALLLLSHRDPCTLKPSALHRTLTLG